MLVASTWIAGTAAAEVPLRLGALVTVVDRIDNEALARRRDAGATALVRRRVEAVADVVVSPGFRPAHVRHTQQCR